MYPELSLTCRGCGRKASVQRWAYVRKYWYDQPHTRWGLGAWCSTGVALCALMCTQCGRVANVQSFPERDELTKLLAQVQPEKHFERVYEKYGTHNPTFQVYPPPPT